MPDLRFGHRLVGPGHPVYFIAEAGSNHNRSFEQALGLIDVAAECGADAVKFQTFRAEALYPRRAGQTDYLKVPRSIYDLIHEMEMPLGWIPELFAYCQERRIDFLSTPFDERSANALLPYVPAFKIASYEMTHHGLVQHCARLGKPLIMSTGTANLDEVGEAVAAARAVGCEELVLLQCTAKYPAPLSALHVRTLPTMAAAFGVPVGLSDHSREALPGPLAAVALGAAVIEKHFTLSNRLPGPDHAYALEPAELAELIRHVRQLEQALGSPEKRYAPEEEELRRFARRSIFTRRAIAQGERLTVGNSAVLRCGKLAAGLHPKRYLHLLGRPALADLGDEVAVDEALLGELRLVDGEVALRPLTEGDTALVVAWRNLPEIHSQLFSPRPPTEEEHRAWFARYQQRQDRRELVIELEGRPVGTIGLANLDLGDGRGDYGIALGVPEARGRGVALRASRLLLEFGFEVLGLQTIRLELWSDNLAARKLYDRLGFVLAPTQPEARLKDGQLREVTAMLLARPAT